MKIISLKLYLILFENDSILYHLTYFLFLNLCKLSKILIVSFIYASIELQYLTTYIGLSDILEINVVQNATKVMYFFL